jgi:SNF2 family DNA or RNA helicase
VTFELRDWQQGDIDKLKDQPARLIGTEMGLGKSYQAFALDQVNVTQTNGNTLYVGPLPTLMSLEAKAHQMGLDVPIVRIDPRDRNGSWERFRKQNGALFLMHWDALRLMKDELGSIKWNHIIADECHKLQGRKTQQTRALKGLKADYKTAMSGTPVTGSPDKMWSALNWLYPKQWSSYWRFFKEMVDYDIVYPQGYHKIRGLLPGAEEELHRLMRPWYVRHLKRDPCPLGCHPDGVAPWMPDAPVYDTYWVELSSKERKAYNDMKNDMIAWVGEHEDSALVAGVVVAQMVRLQQFSGAYMEMTPDGPRLSEPSSKLDAVMQIIQDSPTPVVVWSMFKQMIYLLEERCKKAGIPILLYTGDNRETRDQNVQSFAAGQAQVFAGTISAGGVGVDGLQRASSTMVFLDRLWNPAMNRQAEDRLDRDGQGSQVEIIDIMARNTVDLGRKQRLELKWSWVRQLLGDTRAMQDKETQSDS